MPYELIRSWEDQFESTYGALRHEVSKSFEAYLQCGILAHGCARATCDSCGQSEFIAFSCKKRGVCPSCDAKRSVLFAENLVNNVLLPASHQHLVFTIPKRIRPYFKFDRSNLQFLYSAAWQSLKSLVLELRQNRTWDKPRNRRERGSRNAGQYAEEVVEKGKRKVSLKMKTS